MLIEEGLLIESDESFALTPRGMFFADSIAGLLAAHRLPERVSMQQAEYYNDNGKGNM